MHTGILLREYVGHGDEYVKQLNASMKWRREERRKEGGRGEDL